MKQCGKCLIFFACTLVLTSCGQKDHKKTLEIINKGFESREVQLTWCEKTFLGTMKKNDEGDITLTLTSENLVIPITFFVTKDKITMSMADFESVSEKKMSPALMVYDCLKSLPNGNIKSFGNSAEITYDAFKGKVDLDNEKILFLEFPKGSLTFTT